MGVNNCRQQEKDAAFRKNCEEELSGDMKLFLAVQNFEISGKPNTPKQ